MYCTHCDTEAMADSKFCSKCVKPISIGPSEQISENLSVTDDVLKTEPVGLFVLNKEFKKAHKMNIVGAIRERWKKNCLLPYVLPSKVDIEGREILTFFET